MAKMKILQWNCRSFATIRRSFGSLSTTTSTEALDRLSDRGLLQSSSAPRIPAHSPCYTGFDPTAPSLHVGNLLTLIGLMHLRLSGHPTIALIGGATGAIGDPSGRSTERNALAADTVKANSDSLGRQLQKLFQNMSDHVSRRGQTLPISSPPKILNNSDWFAPMGLLPFLGDLGRHFRVSVMLSRDSVKSRLSSTQGISFTEFSYQILQAFDFYHLYDKEGCAIQLGGSDQWGNMSAGLELIKKKREEKTLSLTSKEKNDAVQAAHPVGITLPLVTTASGDKFGKSAGNAVWLDEKLTSPLDFYQFFKMTPDSEIETYLNYFTFLPKEQIRALIEEHRVHPSKHLPQRALASEVTDLVHGEQASHRASLQSNFLFDEENVFSLSSKEIVSAFESDPRLIRIPKEEFVGQDLLQVLAKSGTAKSKTAARKLRDAGGVYLNKSKVTDNYLLSEKDLIEGSVCLLRTGKGNYRVVHVIS